MNFEYRTSILFHHTPYRLTPALLRLPTLSSASLERGWRILLFFNSPRSAKGEERVIHPPAGGDRSGESTIRFATLLLHYSIFKSPGTVRFLPSGRGGRGFSIIAGLCRAYKPRPATALSCRTPPVGRELGNNIFHRSFTSLFNIRYSVFDIWT